MVGNAVKIAIVAVLSWYLINASGRKQIFFAEAEAIFAPPRKPKRALDTALKGLIIAGSLLSVLYFPVHQAGITVGMIAGLFAASLAALARFIINN